MSPQLSARITPARWLILIVTLVVLIPVIVVLVLHYNSRDPHTAAWPPFGADDRQVNATIERRAEQFLTALRAGDQNQLQAMAFDASDRANVNAFISAFGHRDDRRTSLQTSDLGERYGDLDIAVPCKDGSTQHAVIPFAWKRTSFISSGWYALINKPGTPRSNPTGAQRHSTARVLLLHRDENGTNASPGWRGRHRHHRKLHHRQRHPHLPRPPFPLVDLPN